MYASTLPADQLAEGPTASAGGFAYSEAVVNRLPPPAVSRRALVGFAAGAALATFDRQFPLPIGAEVEIDATAGSIRMLTAAVR
jgi:hypothetical protein